MENIELTKIEGGFATILADPPWRFQNRTGKVAPEHKRLKRYSTMSLEEICSLPVAEIAAENSHLYLWVPNALLPEGLEVMKAWGYRYVTNIIWAKRRKDGGPDGRGVGFYFRNTTEILLFGVKGKLRTLSPARSQVNIIDARKREHSRKPEEQYAIIESCSPGPFLELFARYPRLGWQVWGEESSEDVVPEGKLYPGYKGGPISLMAHQRLTDEAEKEIIILVRDMYEKGISIRKISQETDLSISRIRRLLKKANVEFRSQGAQRSFFD